MNFKRAYILYTLIFLMGVQQCSFKKHLASSNSVFLTRDSLIIGYESATIDSSRLIKRQDSNLVILTFFEKFNDSVILYLNGTEKWRAFITDKNNPNESSGYSGIDVGVSSFDKKNTIRLELLGQKRFVEFSLNKEYPLCSVQRYNNLWNINYRKHLISIK